jgi:hypothetical protein
MEKIDKLFLENIVLRATQTRSTTSFLSFPFLSNKMTTKYKYTVTHNKRDAALSLLESKIETYASRADAHAAASAYVAEYMKDCETSPRTLILFGESSTPIRFFKSTPNYDVITAHYCETGKFWVSVDEDGMTHEFVMNQESERDFFEEDDSYYTN